MNQGQTKINIDTQSNQEGAVDVESMLSIVTRQFMEHRLALAGLITILIFLSIAMAAPLISHLTGLDPDDQNVFHRFKPPGFVSLASSDNREYQIEQWQKKHQNAEAKVITNLVNAGLIEPDADPEDALFDLIMEAKAEELMKISKAANDPYLSEIIGQFKKTHLFGTDELGRDVMIRLIYGARISMGVGIMVAMASVLIGLLIGSISGFYGGWIDNILSRFTESMLSIPSIPLLIVFAGVEISKVPILGPLIQGENESLFKLMVILALLSWMTVARLVRGSILSLKEMDFIHAAKTLGSRDYMIILSHIIPNVIAPLLVAVTLNIGNSILMEAALSFLGLGIQPPTPSWGNMLTNAQELIFDAPSLAILPGMLVLMTVVSFNFVGDGLQDAMDPKAIKR